MEKVKGFSASSSPLLSEGEVAGAAMAVTAIKPKTILLKKCIVAVPSELRNVVVVLNVGRVNGVDR